MDKNYAAATENYCNELSQQIEETVPACRVNNLGFSIIVMFDNRSVCTISPIASDTVDLYAKDNQDREQDLEGISISKCLEVLRQIASLTEETSTADVGGYNPANAFAKPGQKVNRGTEQSKREGWTLMETESRFENPFGEDPTGRLAMNGNSNVKKNSEGKRVSKISHNYENGSPLALNESGSNTTGSIAENQTPEIFGYLGDMLPCDDAQIDGNKLTVTIGSASIIVMAQANGNFSVQSFVAGEPVQENENLPASDLIRWIFEICNLIQDKVAEHEGDKKEMEIEPNDVWETLRELAGESGQSTNIIRNKNLFDLNQGLTVSRSPFSKTENVKRPIEPETEMSGSQSMTESFVRGQRMFNGAPVRLCENNASKPYGNGLNGKKLVYVQGIGATFVDVDKLPKDKFLSWNAATGQVELVEGKQNVKRPSWHFRGWHR